MKKTAKKSRCDLCGRRCLLSRQQRECYKRIPEKISPVWDTSFAEPGAHARFFGAKAKAVKVPSWRLFPETPDAAMQLPRRKVLSADDEKQLFLRYNYARYRLSELAKGQHERTTRARAIKMLEWFDRMQSVRDELVDANMSLVLAMAKRTRIPSVDFPELVSEGNMALLRAIDGFDVSRGYKFSTYACRAILKGFNRMAGKMGRYVSRFGVSYDPDIEPSDYDVHKHEMQRADAVDDLLEIISANQADLCEVERTIVIERFALAGGKPKTLAEVGRIVGLSNERVRQVQKVALGKIRQALIEQGAAA